MSKYCRKCQHLLADNARFCEKCGTAQQEITPAPVPAPIPAPVQAPIPSPMPIPEPATGSDPKPKSKKGLFVALAIVLGIAMVVGLFLTLSGLGGSGSKKGGGGNSSSIDAVLSVHTKIASTGNATNLERIAPQACWETLESESGRTVQEYGDSLEDSYDNEVRDELEDSFGANYKFSYEIKEESELDEDEFEDMSEEIAEANDIDIDTITEGKKLRVKFTVKGSEDEESFSETLYAFKIDGEWYVITEYGNFEIYFFLVNEVL